MTKSEPITFMYLGGQYSGQIDTIAVGAFNAIGSISGNWHPFTVNLWSPGAGLLNIYLCVHKDLDKWLTMQYPYQFMEGLGISNEELASHLSQSSK